MYKNKVYLAGSCKNVSVDERNSWREYVAEKLKENSDGLVAFNPNVHFSYEKCACVDEKTVMDFFLHNLRESNVVVVNLNNSDKSVGTGIEIGYAVSKDKFIIGFGYENVYDYIQDCCSVVFDTIEEVVDFLLEHWD